jgi:hypothetical protein
MPFVSTAPERENISVEAGTPIAPAAVSADIALQHTSE